MNIPSNIYGFSNYREFLKDRYKQLKSVDPSFSFRAFSKDAGFGSPNYLKLVMDGKRNISDEAIEKFAKGVRLDAHETEFFKYMVAHNQCQDVQKQAVYESKLSYLKELFEVKDLIPELYDYYHHWYHAAILEMVKKKSVSMNPKAIGESLVPALSEEKAKASLELLMSLGYIEKNHDGTLVAISKPSKSTPVAEKIYQEQMAELATQSIYTQGDDTQGFESVTISLPQDRVGELKEKIQAWIGQLETESGTNQSDAVFQVNVQLFALTKSDDNAA